MCNFDYILKITLKKNLYASFQTAKKKIKAYRYRENTKSFERFYELHFLLHQEEVYNQDKYLRTK